MKNDTRSKKRRQRQRRKISNMALIILSILGIVLLGDIVGAIMYLRQTPEMQAHLMQYIATGISLSFFQIFWRQLLYQLTIWTMGLTIIGNLLNLFLIFTRGVSAGFNLAVLVQGVGLGTIILWLIQYILILFTTILSVYFSIRFAYLIIKSLTKKKYKLIKKHLKMYATQFVVVMVMVIFTSMLSSVIMPSIQYQMIEGMMVAVEMNEN